MNTIIRKSNIAELKSFDNLFIEMTSKCCNQKCKHCYIDFPQFKKVADFIDIETVKQALLDTSNENIKCIYLTGAEPMNHPDFNAILRECLKKTNVCICTNGSFINEKKARFLKKVENETKNEIIFQISIDHPDEIKNDDIRYRGAYRHAIFAIKHLTKYNFTPIISVTNFYNANENLLKYQFVELLKEYDINSNHILIHPWHDKNCNIDNKSTPESIDKKLDCRYGRILTAKGIYACPFLANDYRGRCGSNFTDFSKIVPLETNFCHTCEKSNCQMFGIDFTLY